MHRVVILLLGLLAAACLVVVALQGFTVFPDRDLQARYLAWLLAGTLALILSQGWLVLFLAALQRQLGSLARDRAGAQRAVEGVRRLSRQSMPWSLAAILLVMVFFFLNPTFGHRWMPFWLGPVTLVAALVAHILALYRANRVLKEEERLLRTLDAELAAR